MYRIAKLSTRAPNGYNLTDGGEGSTGYKATEETKKKQSPAQKRYLVLCVETGHIFPSAREAAIWAGVSRGSIRKACKGILRTAAGYSSMTEAAKWAGVTTSSISYACRKKKQTAGGYHRECVDSSLLKGEECNRPGVKRPVLCIELGKVFSSITEAAKWVGVTAASINNACKNANRTCHGYHWCYAD